MKVAGDIVIASSVVADIGYSTKFPYSKVNRKTNGITTKSNILLHEEELINNISMVTGYLAPSLFKFFYNLLTFLTLANL